MTHSFNYDSSELCIMNENESERGEQEEAGPEVTDQPRPNATGSNRNNRQNNRSQGDIILQGITHQL